MTFRGLASNRKNNNIVNFYTQIPSDEDETKHPIFDLPFRMLIIGPSGSGKTNAVLNVIKSLNGVFTDVSVITKNSQEPLYQLLKDKLKDMCNLYDGIEHTPSVDSFDKKDKHLIIFDDLVTCDDQNAVVEYFIRARKQNCCVIYISQSFYQTPIMIRKNIGYLLIKKLSSVKDLTRIISETSITLDKNQLKQMYQNATREKFNWLMVNLEKSLYYSGFTLIYDANSEANDLL